MSEEVKKPNYTNVSPPNRKEQETAVVGEPKKIGERVSALAWLCPCGLEMSYAERPVCSCGKSVRP